MSDEVRLESRVILLAPTVRDAAASRDIFATAGIPCDLCAGIADVCREAARGAGAAVVTAEALLENAGGRFAAYLQSQPAWSDLPVIVLTPPGTDSPGFLRAIDAIGQVMLMKRPVQVSTLVSAVRAALRDRQRQYAVRDHLAERERAAEVLRAERERFRVILASIGDGVIATDTEERVTFLNPVAQGLTGWAVADALGRPLREVFRIVNESTRVPVENPAVRALKDGVVVGLANHTVLIAGDGTEWPLDDTAAPIRGEDGAVSGAVLVFREISERKEVEAALARATAESERLKRLYEAILSATPDFVYVFSLDHRVIYANEALIEMWGRGREGAIGKTFLEIGYEPWHAKMHDREIDQVRATKQPIRGEVPFVGKFGRRTYDYIFVPVLGVGGEVEAVAGTTRDVTDRKGMEDALKDADRRKDDFIALLAHELRNPLAPIRNGLQVIRLTEDLSTRDRTQRMMDRQLNHMVRMIEDLLDVSRIGRNKMELRRTGVALSDVVDSAVETARPTIEEAGHDLSVTLPREPVYLDADLTRLSQVFSNLLTNSAKYTERGGRIWLSAEARDDQLTVTVRDTGIGIPAAALPTIFDMFSQVDRPTERNAGGLGIGLALVKGLVEMHGGTVSVRSDGQDRGSTFAVVLPSLPNAPESAPTLVTADDRISPGLKRRVLVVDDNRDGAESLALMLELTGNEVALAHDGLEAVERAEEFRPEVIFMDVGMPKLDGLEATKRIRQGPCGRSVTVIALTGWGQDADRERTRAAGCDGHLVKPVNLPDLEKLLDQLRGPR